MISKNSSQKRTSRSREIFLFSVGRCSLGAVLVALSDYGIASIIVGKNTAAVTAELRDRFPKYCLREDRKKTAAALAHALAVIEKPYTVFKLPLDMRGTMFQQRVWEAVRKIPPGATSTYSAIAIAIHAPRAMRAVGSSCTNNHFFMAVPCHRVLHKGESIQAGIAKSSKRQRMLVLREVKTLKERK